MLLSMKGLHSEPFFHTKRVLISSKPHAYPTFLNINKGSFQIEDEVFGAFLATALAIHPLPICVLAWSSKRDLQRLDRRPIAGLY